MTRLCIVHWGMPKTGSTSIQVSLQAAGDSASHRYLSLEDPNAGRALSTMFLDDPRDFHLNRKDRLNPARLSQDRADAFARFEEQFRSGHSTYILSGEAISSMDLPTLRRLRDWLLTQVDEVRAVGYVRKPKGYMESELQQKIKAGRGRFDLRSHYPAYRQRFEPIEEVFGPAQVTYWLFEPSRFPGGDVVRDFVARLGLEIDASDIHRANEALSLGGVRLLYCQRKFGKGYGRGGDAVAHNRRLHRQLRELPGPRLRLSSAAVRPILAEQEDDLRWMEQRLGESLREDLDQHWPQEVNGEEDLLVADPEAHAWLARQLGEALPPGGLLDHQTVADWVTRLRETPPLTRSQDTARWSRADWIDDIESRLGPDAPARADIERVLDGLCQEVLAGLRARQGKALRIAGLGTWKRRAPDEGLHRFEVEAPDDEASGREDAP